MKKSVLNPNYLLPILIFLIAVAGNQVKEASRIKGLRRNWEVNTTIGGTEFPMFRDNGTTNSRIVVEGNSYSLGDRTAGCFIGGGCMEELFKNDIVILPKSQNSNKSIPITLSALSVQFNVIISFPQYLIHAVYGTIQQNNRNVHYSWSDSFKATLRYLERLPGH